MIEWFPDNIWFSIGLKVFFAMMMVGAVMTMAGYSVLAERKVSAWMQGMGRAKPYCLTLL